MIRRLARDRDRTAADQGFTLVELVVVMGIFIMIIGIITATVVTMMRQTQRETGMSDNLDSARKVIQTLDQTVRYANNISTPGTGTDGAYYVEYRTGNDQQQQTCYQWRYIPSSGQVQMRRWLPPLAGVGTSTASPWALEGTGVSLSGSTPIWVIASSTAAGDVHERLSVVFQSSHGAPKRTQTNQVAITGINTQSASPLTSPTCTEIGRP